MSENIEKTTIETLNLRRIWEVMNDLSTKEGELAEQGVYVNLLGNFSQYTCQSFESFLEYYSFRVDGDEIVVFNDSPIPYESFNKDDFSYLPLAANNFEERDLKVYIKEKINSELKEQEAEKESRKKYLEQQIRNLTNQLNNL